MKYLVTASCILLVSCIIFVSFVVPDVRAQRGSENSDINATPAQPVANPVAAATTAVPVPRRPGEVVFPFTHPQRPPTRYPTTVLTTGTGTPVLTETVRQPPATTAMQTTVQQTPGTTTATATAIPSGTATTNPVTVATTATITPSTTPATTPVTPSPAPTTAVTTVATTSPVITVTVIVYRSTPVYSPPYYYPAGYDYPRAPYYPTASLTVTSDPSGAVVLIDGDNAETTPYTFTGLTPEYHTVEVDYPGYEAYVTQLYLDDRENRELDAELVPLVSYGSTVVDSTPEGADVFIDGNYEGTSPATISSLSEGAHQLELHLAGYEVATVTENIVAGQGTVVNVPMAPYSSSSASGSLDIISNVPGALVYLDGIYKGSTESGNIFNVIAVDPGSHLVLLHAPGYTDFMQTVEVTSGHITDVNAVFATGTAATPGATTGSVIATLTPSGGQVYLDNQFRGVTPVTIYDVSSGSHIVNMDLPGYTGWSDTVSVQPGQAAQVAATFTPGGSATPAPTRAGLPSLLAAGAVAIATAVLPRRVRRGPAR